ncbi:MAG: 23S rRNA (pseudouridine(1915)-N(3))-methyltransferase RlmH [Bacteroidota bacterium]|nr:23S rRNA (pseudouridine(1915)-N(3))-methyltransferase RlmH [Bacteroidota bacterium]MDP4213267.1 23S rRNA (pseudouridine(1915)-N(3))-methyltransferase RlmH [Bacteroidota bacterium]MDP4250642.1 23S rRNA (pseudouridine(1915)-N(3))-methyltransferase RlmH [Bacteroidota bacterium]
MKIEFWALGKNHEAYVKSGVEDFTARIQNYHAAEWRIFTPKKNAGAAASEKSKQLESALVLAALKPDDYLVALDEKGKSFSSVKLAGFIQDRANESVKRLIFLIGGAYGLDERIFSIAKTSWSLSALTFPHQLVRLILAEQVYRACSILRNERYHHG